MKCIRGAVSVATFIAVGAAIFLGWSPNPARAQSQCLSQCVNSGSSQAACRSYCFGNQGPQVYGYTSGVDPQNLPAAPNSFTDFSDYAGRPVAKCWPGYSEAYSSYPCWAQEAFSRDRR